MQKPLTTMSNAGFVHLHVHSAYSLLKGSIKIAKLGELAKADRQPALASIALFVGMIAVWAQLFAQL